MEVVNEVIPGEPVGNRGAFARLLAEYLERLKENGFAPGTLRNRARLLASFVTRCAAAGILHPSGLTGELLARCAAELSGVPQTRTSQLSILRTFLRDLAERGHMDFAPLASLQPQSPGRVVPGRAHVPAHAPELTGRLVELTPAYLDHLKDRNYSPGTVNARRRELSGFLSFCAERAVVEPAQLTVSLVERFRKELARRVSDTTGRRLSPATQISRLSMLRDFLRFLVKRGELLFNPALEVELPKMGVRLPRGVLTAHEAERMLCVPDIETPSGLRNRALLELLYSTAIRRAELAALDMVDVNSSAGTVFVRQGKGQVDRVVPVGERALVWLEKYVDAARPSLLLGRPDHGALFVSAEGTRLTPDMVTHIASQARTEAGIEKQGAAHILRHTAATLMLENGADVRHVQQLLGHRELSSTQRYTHVAIRQLKEVHARTHPGANFKRAAQARSRRGRKQTRPRRRGDGGAA